MRILDTELYRVLQEIHGASKVTFVHSTTWRVDEHKFIVLERQSIAYDKVAIIGTWKFDEETSTLYILK